MSEALAEALAEIDDPGTISQLLHELDVGEDDFDSVPDQRTLKELFERYLLRRRDRSPSTISQYKRTIPEFIDFADEKGVKYPAELSESLIDAFVDELFTRYEAAATIITYTKNVRVWLNWLNKRDLCPANLRDLLDKEELGLSPNARDEALPESEAMHIIQKHRAQRYGTAQHALIELLYNSGLRIGEVHSLDVGDLLSASNDLHVRHRPDEGTRLKNGASSHGSHSDGERNITLKPTVVDALEEYIATDRVDVTGDFGREPLFSTQHGRASRSTLRRWTYQATSCRWANEDATEVTCDGSCDPDSDVCPYSYYPHAVRRGSIVNHLNGDLPHGKASERFDVSIPIIKRHYDPRVKETRKQERADAVQNAWSDF
ncbi:MULTISPECIES: tyrosine-type recombinase/integrase [Halolamina]|uniref:Phage integrase, N-terminal SAM-like domain n=1 Tax=Halolamina pelagica TaxID=699431 RepID=A0A1I5TCW2_9EURY|nr:MULTISPECIES: site-specific integrase [Halolamina]NHX37285.1 site-specific integrase [Halolamina sp. R1-12]SFP80883.1 Phage integrase, N-terminal SAM-like domain [Halolamina pelagica]